MSLTKELLQILNNSEEPLTKRVKLVENAFKSTGLPLQHKEAVLLEWSIENLTYGNQQIEMLLYKLLNSEHFRELNRNDISYVDIHLIIERILGKLQQFSEMDVYLTEPLLKSLVQLNENRIFEQFFLHNIELYCTFLTRLFDRIAEKEWFLKCLSNPNLFSKNMVVLDRFYKHFLSIVLPCLIDKLVVLGRDDLMFEEISRVVQKCIFSKSHIFLFEECSDKKLSGIPKAVMKFFNSSCSLELEKVKLSFKIIFHSFSNSCNNFELTYKFFLILLQILGFELPEDIIVKSVKLKKEITLSMSLEILLDLFDVVSQKNSPDAIDVNKLSFTDFIRNILKSIMFLNAHCSLVYKIFLKSIAINPLVIEPIIGDIISFTMLANNTNHLKEYENLIIAVFNVFAKLCRVEKLISKIVRTLQTSLEGKQEFSEVYPFMGINDLQNERSLHIFVENMFTEGILKCFSKCICELGSSQSLLLFKTLLFHLKEATADFENIKENDGQAPNNLVFLEILGTLLCCLLQSVRIAEHTVVENAVNKFVTSLEELKEILRSFATSLLHKEHDNTTVKLFLNMSYYWAEIYVTLSYYSLSEEAKVKRTIDTNYTACNLTYLHSYLSVEQWCSISERISNFGDEGCKNKLRKLYLQKLRAVLLFEKSLVPDIVADVIKDVQNDIENSWKQFLSNKFCVNQLISKLDTKVLIFLADNLITAPTIYEQQHIKDCKIISDAVNYVVLSKINKMFKQKRKMDDSFSTVKPLSSKVFSTINEALFVCKETSEHIENVLSRVKEEFFTGNELVSVSKINEEKLKSNLDILREFPVIFSPNKVQKFMLIYLFALHKDVHYLTGQVKAQLESLVIGILQACKFNLLEIFDQEAFCSDVITHYEKYEVIFSLFVENIFRHEEAIRNFEFCISCLSTNLNEQKFMNCSLIVLNAINKLKKSKMDATVKNIANQYRDKLYHKMFKILNKREPDLVLIKPFAVVLKHNLSLLENDDLLNKLLNKLEKYSEMIFEEHDNNEAVTGYLRLFVILLNNKQRIKMVDNDFILKVWKKCKKLDDVVDFEEYSQLISLVFTLVSNQEFQKILLDLLAFTEDSIEESNLDNLNKHLKLWGTMMSCNVNPYKMKIWQESLETLLSKCLNLVKSCEISQVENLVKNVVSMEEHIVQTQQFLLTPSLIDMFLITPTIIFSKNDEKHFHTNFTLSITLMEKLLKHRNGLIMDRLPPFLQQYRLILSELVRNSNSERNLEIIEINQLSDCAHNMEKFTKNLVTNKKDMGRIAMYLIADILEKYEQVTLYPNVKIHLNNCMYSLISLCDHHAVSYLMRVLSTASTEMFKMLYENYKKYYMFTGKV